MGKKNKFENLSLEDIENLSDEDKRELIEVYRFKRMLGNYAQLADYLGESPPKVSHVLKNGSETLTKWAKKVYIKD